MEETRLRMASLQWENQCCNHHQVCHTPHSNQQGTSGLGSPLLKSAHGPTKNIPKYIKSKLYTELILPNTAYCKSSFYTLNLLMLSSTSSFDGLGFSKDLQENEHKSHYYLCIIHSYSGSSLVSIGTC